MTSIPTASGIYRIVCTVTGKIYIGSAVNLRERWKLHRKELKRNIHHSVTLQRAWNKYGPDAFVFEIIEFVLPIFLTVREQYWLDQLKPFDCNGFNIARIAGSMLGVKHSAETRAKMSTSHQGWKHSAESRAKISIAKQGKLRPDYKISPEGREKLRIAHLGNTYNLGKKQSPEAIEKIRLKNLGRIHSPEAIEKMRIAAFKRPPASPETIAKIKAKTSKTLIIIAPDGTEHMVHGIKAFCKEHGLAISSIMQVAKGKQSQHRGWKARFPEMDVG